jgi:hypothetical protein
MEDWVLEKKQEGRYEIAMLSSLLNPSFQPSSIP